MSEYKEADLISNLNLRFIGHSGHCSHTGRRVLFTQEMFTKGINYVHIIMEVILFDFYKGCDRFVRN